MKPIKLLLSLCAMLVVAVGAWGQSSSSAPTAPGTTCAGTAVSGTTTLTLPANCIATVRLDAIAPNGTIYSGTSTVGVNGNTLTLANATIAIGAVGGDYALEANILSVAGAGCVPGLITNGKSDNFKVTAAPAAPTKIKDFSPSCVGVTPADMAIDGNYATCNGTGTLTIATAFDNTTSGTRDVEYTCVAGACTSAKTSVPYTVNALPPNPTAAGTIAQKCIGEMPTFAGATCPAGSNSTPMLWNETTLALAKAADFTGAAVGLKTVCVHNTTGCISPVAGGLYPTAAPGSAGGGGGSYTPAATPGGPTVPKITAFKDVPPIAPVQVSTPAAATNVATVCTAAGANKLTFSATCAGAPVYVVYDALTGGTPVYSEVAITLGAVTLAANTAITAPASDKDYWIACVTPTAPFCESNINPLTPRVKVSYVVVTTPDAPLVSAPLTICSGTTLTYVANCPAGGFPVRYNTYNDDTKIGTGRQIGDAALTIAVAGVVPPTPTSTLTRYFVCETLNGPCQSTSLKVDVTVLARPAPAGFVNGDVEIAATNSCNGTATIKKQSCAVGTEYFASTSNTGVPVLGLNGAPFSAGAANANFFVFCRNAAGCLSVPVTVGYIPASVPVAPANIALSKNSAACPTNVTAFTIEANCTGAATDKLVIQQP